MSASLTTRLARGLVTKRRTRFPLLTPRPFTSSARFNVDPQRQQITLSRGNGKKWVELSAMQKARQTASTGANLLMIIIGMGLTGAVFTLLYLEVFAPDSAANWFNRTHKRIRNERKCTELLGEGHRIKAYGEPTKNKWSRNRPIASTTKKDKDGTEHLVMRFNVRFPPRSFFELLGRSQTEKDISQLTTHILRDEQVEGDIDKGVVSVHLKKRPGERDYAYHYLFLDVVGKPRVYLENGDDKSSHKEGRKKGLFGVQWGW